MQATLTKPEIRSRVFRLCNTKKSGWLKDETGGDTGVPAQYMHTSNVCMLNIKSRLYLGRDLGYMPTMFVVGASTHYVDDYWEDKNGKFIFEKLTPEQGKEKDYNFRPGLLSIYGEKRLQEEEGKSKRWKNGICFTQSVLDLTKYGDNPVLLRFVMEHEQNVNAPNSKENTDPSRVKLFMFEPLIAEKKALKDKSVESFDDNLDAMNFVAKLRTKTKDGYTYNEEKMDAVLSILQAGIGLAAGEVNQKFKVIVNAQKNDGAAFMQLMNSVMEDYRTSLGVAVQLNVLEYTATESKLTIDGQKRTATKFKGDDTKEDIIDGLVLYFLGTAKGKNDYKDMRRAVESAKIAAVSKL